MPEDLVITIDDVRKAGFCPSGARRWFESYGFDFRQFVQEGMPAADLLETGDAQAQIVVEKALSRGR